VNTLTLLTLLYGCEIWAIKKQDKPRSMSAEMKFMWRRAKYTWQDYKSNEDILTELEINQPSCKENSKLQKCTGTTR
jgi:hypothetical protein